jgi:hypothetical protein
MTARIHCRDYAQSASRVIESEIAHQRAEVRAGRSKARAVRRTVITETRPIGATEWTEHSRKTEVLP